MTAAASSLASDPLWWLKCATGGLPRGHAAAPPAVGLPRGLPAAAVVGEPRGLPPGLSLGLFAGRRTFLRALVAGFFREGVLYTGCPGPPA